MSQQIYDTISPFLQQQKSHTMWQYYA